MNKDIPLGSLCSEINCGWFNTGYSRSCARNNHKFHENKAVQIKIHEKIREDKIQQLREKMARLRLSDTLRIKDGE